MFRNLKIQEWMENYNLVFFMMLVSFGWLFCWLVIIVLALAFI